VTLNLEESAARQGADFRAAEAFEQRHPPLAMLASARRRADEDEF
jgi:hypothetical protein